MIDAKEKKARPGLPAMRQFCEPEQPGVTLYMGPHHRRWSFMIFPGESPDDAIKPDSVWRRLDRPEGATPEEVELIRVASYQFQSLYAKRWRVSRVFLAGDAAHQMPPFLAQGLCSGFRDAHNLAWKLDLVLKGLAGDRLLDAYEAERGPSARATIVESMRVGLNVNERDPEKGQSTRRTVARDAGGEEQQSATRREAHRLPRPGLRSGLRRQGDTGRGRCLSAGARESAAQAKGDSTTSPGRGFLIIARGADPMAAPRRGRSRASGTALAARP